MTSDVRKRAADFAPVCFAPALAHHARELGARAVQRREEAEHEPGRHRERAGERDAEPVEREVKVAATTFGGISAAIARERPLGDEQARDAADERRAARSR